MRDCTSALPWNGELLYIVTGDSEAGVLGLLPDTGGSGKWVGGAGKEASEVKAVGERTSLSSSIDDDGLVQFGCGDGGAYEGGPGDEPSHTRQNTLAAS